MNKAILCVDDEAIILIALIEELKSYFGNRYHFVSAVNAESALSEIDNLFSDGITVALIITDWLMPGIKGDEFLSLAKEKYSDIPAIMITGQADQEAIDKVLKCNLACAVIKKPWGLEELITSIERCCAGEKKCN